MSLLRASALAAMFALPLSAVPMSAQQSPVTLADLLKRPEVTARTIANGETKTGVLADANDKLSDSSRVDLWYFRGSAGQRVRVRLRADDFDTFLHLGKQGGSEPLVQNDDAGDDGVNSAAELTLPEDGVYVIIANAYEASGRGSYSVDLAVREPAPGMTGPFTPERLTLREAEPNLRLGLNQRFGSQLDDKDGTLADGSPFELWYVSAAAGDTLQLSVEGAGFTPALHLGRQGSGSLLASAAAGSATPSLRVVIAESGVYAIVVSGTRADARGSYSLSISKGGER